MVFFEGSHLGGGAEGSQWVPILDPPLAHHHPSFAIGNLLWRTKCAGLALLPILAHMVKGWAASSTCRLCYIAPRSPTRRSCTP